MGPESLKEKWNLNLNEKFYEWFQNKRFNKFVESIIVSVREGTDIKGLYYQNDIESVHVVEKIKQCFEKHPLQEVSKI